jgi:2-iminoacetate synthase
MAPPDLLPLVDFVELVKASDPDAAHRMILVDQVAPVLFERAVVPAEQKEAFADRLERWRYQVLNKYASNLSPNQRKVIEWLDRAAALLWGRPRLPRHPRTALAPAGFTTGSHEPTAFALAPDSPLEQVMRQAAELTARHFPGVRPGRRMMMLYAPLYLSSFCINHCVYCAFRYPHSLVRRQLSVEEALAQAEVLRRRGFRHLLLVAGDFPRMTSPDYLTGIVRALVEEGFSVAVEVAPQTTLAYTRMARAGACGVTLYQETYHEPLYARYHPLGPKTWFDWRLEAPERAAETGMSRLGLGILLGLADPQEDLRALIGHGRYLLDRFPALQLAFSLPRIHEAPADFEPPCPVDDEMFVRLYCALRFAFPTAHLVLSTREQPALRDRLARICITQMSAGSSTAPGGYDAEEVDLQRHGQFPVCDDRSPAEVTDMLRGAGFDVHWEPAGNDRRPAVRGGP